MLVFAELRDERVRLEQSGRDRVREGGERRWERGDR